MKQLFILVFLVTPLWIFAQSNATIVGKIIETETNSPVMHSSVALYTTADSSLVKGVITDENGNFLIANVPDGQYYIDISYMGYQKISKDSITINTGTQNHDVGTVEMHKEVNNLEEVVVEGELLKSKVEIDRTSYTVNSKMAAASHSGLEILRQVPTVQVDFQNNISINGSSNILIFVDDKQRDGDYLSQLDPASIERIEVMETPSAKYSSSANAVLFIFTKREMRLGVSGRLEGEIPVGIQKISNNSANLEYGYKNMRLFASGYMHYESFNDIENNDSRISDVNDVHSTLTQNNVGEGTFTYNSIQYGFDYFLNDHNSFSFYGNYRSPLLDNENEGSSTSVLLVDNELTDYFTVDNSQLNNDGSHYYSLFYKHTFDKKGHEITGDVNYYSSFGNSTNNYRTQYYQDAGMTPIGEEILRKEVTKNNRSQLRTKIDYSLPLGENLKFETGYEGSVQWYDNKFYVTSDEVADQLDYQENLNAGYMSVAGKWKKFSYQVGARGDYSNVLINSDTTVDYFCFQPQFNISYKLNNTNTFKLVYSKTIRRPGVRDLNPFVRYTDSLHVSRGNPSLVPRYKHHYELSYTKNIKSNYLTYSVYLLKFENMFNSVVTINEDNVSESYVDNVGEGSEYGMNLRGGFQVFKFWRINSGLTFFYKELHSIDNASVYNIPDQDIYCVRGNFSSMMFFPKDIMFMMYAYYESPNINPQVTFSRDPVYIVALQKGLFEKKAQVSLFTYLPFWKDFNAYTNEYEGMDFTQTSEFIIPVKSLVTLRLSYRFNYGKKIEKIDRDSNVNEDGGGGLF